MLCFYLFWSCPLCNFSLLMCSFIYRCKCVSVQGKNWWKKLCLRSATCYFQAKFCQNCFPSFRILERKCHLWKTTANINQTCAALGKTFIMEKMKNNIQNWKQKELLAWCYSTSVFRHIIPKNHGHFWNV